MVRAREDDAIWGAHIQWDRGEICHCVYLSCVCYAILFYMHWMVPSAPHGCYYLHVMDLGVLSSKCAVASRVEICTCEDACLSLCVRLGLRPYRFQY